MCPHPSPDSKIQYQITDGNYGGVFDIDSETGVVRVKNALDFERVTTVSNRSSVERVTTVSNKSSVERVTTVSNKSGVKRCRLTRKLVARATSRLRNSGGDLRVCEIEKEVMSEKLALICMVM